MKNLRNSLVSWYLKKLALIILRMVWSLTFNILNRFTFLVIFSPDVRESKTVLDSGFHTVDSGFQYLSLELGFWIPVVSGILDSLSCIPDSKDQDSGFHK